MIRNLNQLSFQCFGIILPAAEQAAQQVNRHCIALSPQSAQVYQAVAPVWLSGEAGMTVLSVSADNEHYEDFYLDKQVTLHSGIWFTLTALQGNSSVQMAGISLPRLVQTRFSCDRFLVRPRLRVESVCTFFYQEKEQSFLFPGEAHSMIELTYVDQGALHSVVEGRDLLLNQGDIVFYGPEQWHMQYSDIGVAPRFVTVNFTASGCDLSSLFDRKFQSSQKAVSLLQQMLREQELSGEYSGDSIICLLTMLLITLLRETVEPDRKLQPSNSINSENEIISRAQQYISLHVREKLSVPLVARSVDVSASYLTALFHKHLQIAPGEYIRRIKLQQSKQLIREGTMNFTQIAEELKYSTVHQFSRQFKEKFGITPTEYAKSVR